MEGAVIYNKEEIKKITISSTLIKHLFHKGEPRDRCPRKTYHVMLLGDMRDEPNENMIKGLVFEKECLGSTRDDDEHYEIPKLKSGEPSIDEKRIMEQAAIFPKIAEAYGMIIIKEGDKKNVQIQNLATTESSVYPDLKIAVRGTADVVTPLSYNGHDFSDAVVDLKLTADRDSRFGEYSWGNPEYMDHTQGVLYSTLFDMPFAYLVFDYKGPNRGHKLIPLITKAGLKHFSRVNEGMHNLANQRQTDLKVVMSDVIERIMVWDSEGYPEIPGYQECSGCPLSPVLGGDCEKWGLIQQI